MRGVVVAVAVAVPLDSIAVGVAMSISVGGRIFAMSSGIAMTISSLGSGFPMASVRVLGHGHRRGKHDEQQYYQ